jgi:hypothetical protein
MVRHSSLTIASPVLLSGAFSLALTFIVLCGAGLQLHYRTADKC